MLRKLLFSVLTVCITQLVMGQTFSLQVSLRGTTCEYSAVRFEASVNNQNPYICRWWKVGELRDHLLTSNSRIYEIPVLRPSDAGAYYCTVTETESGIEKISDTLQVRVSPLVVYLPEGIPAIGERDELPVTAIGSDGNLLDNRYLSWSYGSLSQWGAGNQTQLPAGSGSNPFRLKGIGSDMLVKVRYDYNNCIGYDSLRVRVKPSRYYWGGPEDGYARVSSAFRLELNDPLYRTYCEGETLRFKITAISDGGSSGFQYQWWHIRGGYNIPVSTDTAFYLSPARLADDGAYYCEVRDENGFTVLSDTQYINLNPLQILVSPSIFYAGEGEVVRVAAYHTNGDTISCDSLQWFINGRSASTGITDRALSLNAGSGDFIVKAVYTNSLGCIASDSMSVIAKAHQQSLGGVEDGFAKVGASFTVERILPAGSIEEYCLGGSVPLQARVTGENSANYNFRWWKISRPSNRLVAERDSFSLENMADADAGLYFCEARDANGSTAFSDTLLLTRHSVDLPRTYYATAGEQVTFVAVNAKGETITTPVVWSERMEGDPDYYPLPDTDNPLHYAISTGTTIRVTSNFREGCTAVDTTCVIVRNNNLFSGTEGDGFDQSIVPPTILRPFLPAQLCTTFDSVTLQLYAEGSDLSYSWQQLDEQSGSYTSISAEFLKQPANTSLLQLHNLPFDYERIIRCMVSNSLDTVYSRDIQLYGHHLLSAKIIPDVVRFGEETSASVSVCLEHGTLPWSYRYESPRGVSRSRTGINDSTSLFTVSDLGIYRLTYLSDALGCESTSGLPDVEVTTYKIPKVTLSGGGEICAGTNVNLQLSIREGIGPWEITLNCDGVAADHLNLTWPLRLTARDTSVWFNIQQSGVYTIDTIVDLNNGGKRWGGTVSGEALFTIRESDNVRFSPLSDNHTGICHPLDLYAYLLPLVNNSPDHTGTFFVDGTPVSGDWTPLEGQHNVRYLQRPNSLGCSGSAEITLVVDPLPEVSLIIPEKDICMSGDGELSVHTSGNGVSFTLGRDRINRETKVHTQTYSAINTDTYVETVHLMNVDSCLIYTVKDISDKHGCRPVVTPSIIDTVYNRLVPNLQIQTRYPDLTAEEWVTMNAGDTLYTWGDIVGLQAFLVGGLEPFGIECKQLPYFNGNATGIADAGIYRFNIRDRYCANDNAGEFTVLQIKPIYLRLKVLLEGLTDLHESRELGIDLYRDGIKIASGAGKVFDDGTVTGMNDENVLSSKDFISAGVLQEGRYEIVVRSSGYLSVRSKKSYVLTVDKLTVPLVDFTDGANVLTTEGNVALHMTRIGNRDGKDIWALSTVEGNQNELISVRDVNVTVTDPVRFTIEGNGKERTQKNRDKYADVSNK